VGIHREELKVVHVHQPPLIAHSSATLLSNRAERKSRSHETALPFPPKLTPMILRLLLPHDGDLFSSLVFATVPHSAPSLGKSRQSGFIGKS